VYAGDNAPLILELGGLGGSLLEVGVFLFLHDERWGGW